MSTVMSVTAAHLRNNKLIFISLSTLFYSKAHHAAISNLRKSAVFCDWGDIRMNDERRLYVNYR